jgi:hypothetical protein
VSGLIGVGAAVVVAHAAGIGAAAAIAGRISAVGVGVAGLGAAAASVARPIRVRALIAIASPGVSLRAGLPGHDRGRAACKDRCAGDA